MATMEVQLDQAAIRALLGSRSGPVARHLLTLGHQVEALAKMNAPVNTGRLRSSITTGLYELPGPPYLSVRVGSDVEYAVYVHEGTRYMAGNPFLVEALRAVVGF